MPSTPALCVVGLDVVALEPVGTPPACPVFPDPFPALEPDGATPLFAVQAALKSVVGDGPADASATRHADPEGVPAAPFPSGSLALKSSDAEDHEVPQLVPRVTSVGTPGDASAVEHVDDVVGSSTDPTPATPPAKDAIAFAIRFARTLESDTETSDSVASASADGPEVVGAATDPSGTEGSGSEVDAFVGAVAVVPGPVAVVELLEGPVEPGVVVELEAVIGLLGAKVAGPASPPPADAEPPAVEPWGPGRRSGSADAAGPSASARPADTFSSAITAISSSSFLIS